MGRPSVDIVSQIGIEITPGTAVLANRFLPTVTFNPHIKRATKEFRSQGSKYNSASVPHKKWADGSFDGILDYNSWIYIMSCLTAPASGVSLGGGSTGYGWNFLPNSRSLDNPKTITIEKGDASAVDKYSYGQLSSLTVDLGQDDIKFNGKLIAQSPNVNQAQTASPTEIAERPVQRGQIDVYLDDTFGGIGTTQITDAFEEQIQLGEKFKPKFVHNSSIASFKEAIEVAPSLVFSFMTEHNAQSRSILANMLTQDAVKYMRIKCTGGSLGGSTSELIQFDLAGKFTEPEEIMDALNQGVYGYRYHFVALADPTMGRPWSCLVQNALSAL